MTSARPDKHTFASADPVVYIAVLLSNIVVPGLGLCLRRKVVQGLVIEFLWLVSLALLVWAMAFHGLHPVKAVIVAGVLYAVTQVDLILGYPRKQDGRVSLSMFDYLGGLLFFVVGLDLLLAFGFKPYLGLALVTDRNEYPLLMPGDLLLYKKARTAPRQRDRGRLFVTKHASRVEIQRLVGFEGDVITVTKDGMLNVNGQSWPRKEVKIIHKDILDPVSVLTTGYLETVPDTKHTYPVVFGPLVFMPKFHKKVDKGLFFLADNRSGASVVDSRMTGPLPKKAVLGTPIVVLMTLSPKGRVSFKRSGIRPWP